MPAVWQVSISKEFWQDIGKLPAPIMPKVWRVMTAMTDQPLFSDFSDFQSEKVKSAEQGIYSCRADQDYRIIWKKIKPKDMLFCLVDKHDEAYHRAARKSFCLENGVVRYANIEEVKNPSGSDEYALFNVPAPGRDQGIGKLFKGYLDKELLEMGVPADLLPNVRAVDTLEEFAQIERLFEQGEKQAVFYKLFELFLEKANRPVVPDDKLRASLEQYQGGDEIYRFVDSEEFKRALQGEMADWMLFLAPVQRALTLREYNGPARLKGVSGSGKTVIALHRARMLARKYVGSPSKVLFLTYGNRLPKVMKFLYRRLAGENSPEADRVDFKTIHSWCSEIIATATGHRPCVDTNLLGTALSEALTETQESFHNSFDFARHSPQFFVDEFRYGIKGRVVRSLEQYLKLERSGRGSPLQENDRRAIWDVYTRYQNKLQVAGVCDYDDFILQALELVENKAYRHDYVSLVVDEIQDLTEAIMRLIRTAVPPATNDLFLVGDGMQRIYPGGYSLGRLGIDITGRGTLLKRNYRNTQEILQAAHAVMQGISFDDMEEGESAPETPEYSVRHGPPPVMTHHSSPENEIAWIIEEIDRLKGAHGYRDEDFAILYPRKPYDDYIQSALGKTITWVLLSEEPQTYFGPGIKVTTFYSAKGLEFKVVFVAGLTDGQFMPYDDWQLSGQAAEEDLARQRNLLYVAMSRARDLLYLSCARGALSRFLTRVPEQLLRRKGNETH